MFRLASHGQEWDAAAQESMKVALSNLKPGLKLLRDVTNRNGGILLTAGTVLTSQQLSILERCEIQMVDIAADSSDPSLAPPPLPRDIVEKAQGRIKERLKHVPQATPGLRVLEDLAVKRLAAIIMKKESPGDGNGCRNEAS